MCKTSALLLRFNKASNQQQKGFNWSQEKNSALDNQ